MWRRYFNSCGGAPRSRAEEGAGGKARQKLVTIPLMNPYETRVLPALAQVPPRPASAPSRTPKPTTVRPDAPQMSAAPQPIAPARSVAVTEPPAARRRLAIQLQGQDWLEIWDDRIVTADHMFTLDNTFGAHVTPDWRAPLTVDAQLGLALRDERGRWNIYVPQTEEQIWQAIYVLRGVCEARGLALPDLEPTVLDRDAPPVEERTSAVASMPTAAATRSVARSTPVATTNPHAYEEHTYANPRILVNHPSAAWIAPNPQHARPTERTLSMPPAAEGMSSDSVLIAIVHLSVLFLPVILPATVWLALRRSVPWVAAQASEAVRFQVVVACMEVLLLGSATLAALVHGSNVVSIGLAGFIILLAAAGVYAFYAVLRATSGHAFHYLGFLRRDA